MNDNMNDNLIRIATSIQDLTGKGEEWLMTEHNEIIAIFINGNLKEGTPTSTHNGEITKKGTTV